MSQKRSSKRRRSRPVEDQLKVAVIGLLQSFGFRVVHFRPARVLSRKRDDQGNAIESWRTPVEGDNGFMDITAARISDGTKLFIELKNADHNVEPGQAEWLDAMAGSAQGVRFWNRKTGDLPPIKVCGKCLVAVIRPIWLDWLIEFVKRASS